MKYIFIAGAPGSKWSSVAKNIYYSPGIDNTDYSDNRLYYHNASGKMELMHMGAYFDPGMEFDLPEDLTSLTKEQAEKLFDIAFTGAGVKIVKSHIFSYKKNVDFLKQHWPDCPIVLVYRSNDSCLGWWVKCGHFNITYPLYHDYYKDLPTMATIIEKQNQGIVDATISYPGTVPYDNKELCKLLGIEPPHGYEQVYEYADIKVVVI
jgi:hypothetical protein